VIAALWFVYLACLIPVGWHAGVLRLALLPESMILPGTPVPDK
jgi:hypothetical protein